MDKVLITPIASSGIAPFEVEGKLESKYFPDDGLIYYIGGHSFCADIVTILHPEESEETEAAKVEPYIGYFGINLMAIRESKKLQKKDLSEMTGLTIRAIQLYESGMSCPTLVNAIKIANALEVSLDEMCKKR